MYGSPAGPTLTTQLTDPLTPTQPPTPTMSASAAVNVMADSVDAARTHVLARAKIDTTLSLERRRSFPIRRCLVLTKPARHSMRPSGLSGTHAGRQERVSKAGASKIALI